MKRNNKIININEAQKMTCAELAAAISVATDNVQRYSKLREGSSKVMEAAEKHFIDLLAAQKMRAM